MSEHSSDEEKTNDATDEPVETDIAIIPTHGGDGGKGVVMLSGGVLKLAADRSFSRAMLEDTSADKSDEEAEIITESTAAKGFDEK